MSGQLRPELRTVRKLFDDGATYTVPIYQRNYAWGVEQIEQLIRDVADAMKDDDEGYFLGNLVVVDRGEPGAPDFEVVDGQQRLTTLYLLLTALAGRGAGGWSEHHDRLRYESRPRATEALRAVTDLIERPGSEAGAVSDEDAGILVGLNVVRQCLQQKFADDQSPAGHFGRLDALADYLRDQVTVVRACLPSSIDLNRYFEVMNTRGQQLAQVDIVKARLMSRLTDDPAGRACFAKVWDACADMDSYVQMTLTKGNTALRTRLFGDDWTWLRAYGWHDLQEELRGDSTPSSEAAGGSRSLDDALRLYAAHTEAISSEDADNVRFRSTIDFSVFLLHALKVHTRHTTDPADDADSERLLDDKKLIARFETLCKGTSADIRNFAFDLLRLRNLFDAYVLKRQYTARTSEDGDWSLQRLVKQASGSKTSAGYRQTLATNSTDTDDTLDDDATRDLLLLQSMLRVTYTSPRTMHWLTRLLAHLADAPSPDAAGHGAAALLRDYARAQVRISYLGVDPEPTGFGINRIVFTYLDYLYLQQDDAGQWAAYRFGFRNSIEHFYPQLPDQEQRGPRLDPDNLHLLGNLALVSVSANSKFGNSVPGAKATNFEETIEVQSPKLHRMAEMTRHGCWGDVEVRQHHAEVLDLLQGDLHNVPKAMGAKRASEY